ncbi:MAG: hypothetical protein QM731_24970 [Chitinophagaceae bacterium]
MTLLLFSVYVSYAQPDPYSCVTSFVSKNAVFADSGSLGNTLSAIDDFPRSSFYLMAELHGVNATPIMQLALIRKVKKVTGLKYIILEMSHSNAFIMNRYLETGDGAYFGYLTDARRCRWLLDSLRALNHSLQSSEQVRFIGVDMEYGNIDVYKKAMELFLEMIKAKTGDNKLTGLLEAATKDQKKREYMALNEQIRGLLKEQVAEYKELLGVYYPDLLMIVSNEFDKEGIRDDEMFLNFSKNVHAVFELQPNEPFFASFGASHVPLLLEKRFLHLMSDYYKAKELNLCFIGTQYFDCYSVEGTVKITNDGSVAAFGSYGTKHGKLLQSLQESWLGKGEQFAIVDLKSFSCDDVYPVNLLQKPDLMVMCRGFGPLKKGNSR